MQSIFQDFGDIPGDYLFPAGDGDYNQAAAAKCVHDVCMGTNHEDGAYLFNEWAYRRQDYSKGLVFTAVTAGTAY